MLQAVTSFAQMISDESIVSVAESARSKLL